jgi:hypothetical protein
LLKLSDGVIGFLRAGCCDIGQAAAGIVDPQQLDSLAFRAGVAEGLGEVQSFGGVNGHGRSPYEVTEEYSED